jgi:hypothetical protein
VIQRSAEQTLHECVDACFSIRDGATVPCRGTQRRTPSPRNGRLHIRRCVAPPAHSCSLSPSLAVTSRARSLSRRRVVGRGACSRSC